MMVERVAAGPVDQLNVGIVQRLAVVVERLAGAFQHVGDASDRDEFAHRVRSLRQRRPAEAWHDVADAVRRAVADAEAAAGQADLAQHAGNGQQGPERLLAMVRALQRPGDRDHRAHRREFAREAANALGGHGCQRGGPLGSLGDAVGLTQHVGDELLEADAVRRQELRVVQALGIERVRDRQQHRGVAVRADRDPFVWRTGVEVAVDRAHVDEAHPGFGHAAQALTDLVMPDHALRDLRVLGRHAAEADEQPGVLGQYAPACVRRHQLVHRRDQVGHQHPRRTQAVGVGMAHVAAERVQETVNLALRVVEAAGA
jgi:hypothetical protein